MADSQETDDKFVEIDGEKYKEDPEHEGEALKDDDENLVPFEEKKEEEKEEKDPEISDPEPRRSAASHIIERKQKKIEKLKKPKEGEEETTEEEVAVAPEGEAAIDKKLEPIKSQMKKQSDDQEFKDILNDTDNYPHAKKLKDGIKRYMDHPAYQDASVDMIYHALVSKTGIVKSAAAKKAADEETKETNIGGGNTRRAKDTKLPDFGKMTDKEFDEFESKNR